MQRSALRLYIFNINLHMLMLMNLYSMHLVAQYNLTGDSPLTRARTRSSTRAALAC